MFFKRIHLSSVGKWLDDLPSPVEGWLGTLKGGGGCSGSVVESLTRDLGVEGLSLTALCP